jgi:hypothetical protein
MVIQILLSAVKESSVLRAEDVRIKFLHVQDKGFKILHVEGRIKFLRVEDIGVEILHIKYVGIHNLCVEDMQNNSLSVAFTRIKILLAETIELKFSRLSF